MATPSVDARCSACPAERGVYRMVGSCYNCHTEGIVILYTATHEAGRVDCPVCGCWRKVYPERLATEDEVPDLPSGGDRVRSV